MVGIRAIETSLFAYSFNPLKSPLAYASKPKALVAKISLLATKWLNYCRVGGGDVTT
jgi:hypothetical protein